MSFLVLQGDARHIPLRDESVQCVVTSPPFFGLRDYGTGRWEGGLSDCEHERVTARNGRGGSGTPGKQTPDSFPSSFAAADCGKCGAVRIDKQIGLESSLTTYLTEIMAVFKEVWRVLRKDGTCWVEIGDSYAANRTYQVTDNKHVDVGNNHSSAVPEGLKAKDLMGVPWRLAFTLQDAGWYLRQDIIWHRPNPMPESVQDRCTKSHSYIFLLTKSANYYYDANAVREKNEGDGRKRGISLSFRDKAQHARAYQDLENPGRNARSVWTIPTESFPGQHFATMPTEIVKRCVLAGSSEKGVCSGKLTKLRLKKDLSPERLAQVHQYLERKGLV